jgi:Peroxidase
LRLGFHDCAPNGPASGCDGCINLTHEENFGLLPVIQALSGIVSELENPALGVSRADIWAFAALVAAEVSQTDITFLDEFQVGRRNCETVGTCDSSTTDCTVNGPDQITDFLPAEATTHELMTYMRDHFDFDADQTVAIMGAHTMGRALPENSGYEGQFGWVSNPLSLGMKITNDILLASYVYLF